MAWPLSQDYNEAIQTPRTSFHDPELRDSQAVVNTLGLPQPCSGNFADVYEVYCRATGTRWAVKCFTRAVPDLRERYSAISSHLREARLPFFVEFEYLDPGIRVRGQWYPVLKMQWVEGLLLNAFVRAAADRPSQLEALNQIWVRMGRRLREGRLAHADLQHGNVLLVPGSKTASLAVKLLDYDGLYVPALAAGKSGEVGHPAYQHPQRVLKGIYNLAVDRFPLLVIATALRCLRVGGRKLWDRYDNGDNLLFRGTDLAAPGESALVKELWQLEDAEAQALVGQLVLASRRPLEATPLLDDLLGEGRTPALRAADESQVALLLGLRGRAVSVTAVLPVAALAPAVPPSPPPTRAPAVPPPPINWAALSELAAAPASQRPTVPVAAVVRETRNESSPLSSRRRRQRKAGPSKWRLGAVAGAGVVVLGVLLGLVVWSAARMSGPVRPGPALARTGAGGSSELKDLKRSVNPVDEKPAGPQGLGDNGEPTPEPVGEVRRFVGHTAPVLAVAFSPDGRRLLTAGIDRTLRLWDVASGRELGTFTGHGDTVSSVAYAPDGRSVLSGSLDRTVRLWDVATGQERLRFLGHTKQVDAVAFGGGQRVLSISRDDTCRIWDTTTGREVGRCGGGPVLGYALAVSPRGDRALFSRGDHAVCLWDVAAGQELRRLPGHTAHVYALAFAPAGKLAASTGGDGTIRLWDLNGGRERQRLTESTQPISSLAFSPDGRRLVSGGSDRTVRLWDLESGAELRQFEGHTFGVHGVAYSPDGWYAASVAGDATARLWRLPSEGGPPAEPAGEVRQLIRHPDAVRRLALSPDGRWLLTACRDGRLRRFDADSWRLRNEYDPDGQTACETVVFAPDGRTAFSGSGGQANRGRILHWDVAASTVRRRFEDNGAPIYQLAVFPDGRRVVSCGPKWAWVVWDVATGRRIHGQPARATFNAVAVSADGNEVLAGGEDRVLHLWDPARKTELRRFMGHTGTILWAGFAPDGRSVVSAASDGTIRLWNVAAGRQTGKSLIHGSPVWGAAFSPDGRRLLSVSQNALVRLWDVDTGGELRRFAGHQSRVFDCLFTRDGQYALTGGEDRTVRVWRLSP